VGIDPSKVGAVGEAVEHRWTAHDCLLYALGVGAGLDELEFSSHRNQRVLPTFAVIVGSGGAPLREVGTFNPVMLVHGGQSIEVLGLIPTEGAVRTTGRIAAIYDKGSGAVIETESESRDVASGELRFRTRSSVFLRGEGGFGGERGPSGPINVPPDRAPDHQITYETRPDQALLYRLSGDLNPLHSDPDFAARAGFPRPILHGLCTYGFTGRALLHTLCGSDPARFRSMEGRFSKPVFPGESLTVQIWGEGTGAALFQTLNPAGEVVFAQGRCEFKA
jgi:acyl dehydratase